MATETTTAPDEKAAKLAKLIVGFPWHNFGLDNVGEVKLRDADYAHALAAKILKTLDAEPVEHEYGVRFPSVTNRAPIVEWCRNEGTARAKVANLDRSSLVRRAVGTPEEIS